MPPTLYYSRVMKPNGKNTYAQIGKPLHIGAARYCKSAYLNDVLYAVGKTVERRHELPPQLAHGIGELTTLTSGEIQREIAILGHGKECKTHLVPKPWAKIGA